MAGARFRPSRQIASTLFVVLFTIIAVFSFLPVAWAAENNSTEYTTSSGSISDFGIAIDNMPHRDTVIGIDLGGTHSCVAVSRNGHVKIIANEQGYRTTPTWVAFGDEERLVGTAVTNASHISPENTVFDAKRLIGRKMDDADVRKDMDMKQWPFKVDDKDGNPVFSVNHRDEQRDFTPQEITAMILSKMKDTAEAYLGENITYAAVTVPTYFNDAQRKATRDAGKLAGLDILRIINEPTAAAIAYGLHEKGGDTRHLIYHLGGGTCAVSLLSIDDGVFEILATAGNTRLGGDNFDHRVAEYLRNAYEKKTGIDVTKNLRAMERLKREAKRAKHALSSQQSIQIKIESFENGNNFSEILTRAKFEELNDDLFLETIKYVGQVLQEADMKKHELDEILVVGGSTRIPKIQRLLDDYFGKRPLKTSINPEEAVAYGAAVLGDDSLNAPPTQCTFGLEDELREYETMRGMVKLHAMRILCRVHKLIGPRRWYRIDDFC